MAPRLLSAAVGLPLLLAAVWLGSYWLAGAVALVAALAYRELHRLLAPLGGGPPLALGLLFTLALALNGLWGGQHTLWVASAGLLASLAWQLLAARGGSVAAVWAQGIAGPLYLGVPLSFALLLRALDGGREWLLLVLLVTFATDTAAFLVGRSLGRRRMAPAISPKKTWEGAIGGLAGAAGAAVLLGASLGTPMAWWQAVVLGLALGVAGQVGDLVESYLKRAGDLKEAGGLIPGHGGVLDRLDSVVFTLVVGYYGAMWVMR